MASGPSMAPHEPAAVVFDVTGSMGTSYTFTVRDRFLNESLRRDVLSVSPISGAVEGSTRWLAARLNEAEALRRAHDAQASEIDASPMNASRFTSRAQANLPPVVLSASPSSSSSLDSSALQPYRQLPPVYEDDEEFSQLQPSATRVAARATASAAASPTSSTANTCEPAQEPTLADAIRGVAETDTGLFFELVSQLYEVSRAPTISGGNGGEVWTLAEHCAGFQLCCAVFRDMYDRHVRPFAAATITDFAAVSMAEIRAFRQAVLDTFHLRPAGPGITSSSQIAADEAWVRDCVEHDPYFFNKHVHRAAGSSGRAAAALMTMSAAPASRVERDHPPIRQPLHVQPAQQAPSPTGSDATPKENEMPTYYMNDLLKSPSWEPDDASVRCRLCDRPFVTRWPPFLLRSHHCRSCGRRLCVNCTSFTAHRTFAKLTKPNSSGSGAEEGDMRPVCRSCFRKYGEVERLRYLGALFVLSGLTVADLSLCRTVNLQWRQAAELCLSEYRLLLHQCERDPRTVLTPVGVLLQNSIDLIVTTTTAVGSKMKQMTRLTGQAEQNVLCALHPEPTLVLLKFIEAKQQWSAPSTATLLAALARYEPRHVGCGADGNNGASSHPSPPPPPRFSHWHFYCTAFCTQMPPAHFAVKAAEHLCAAPPSVVAAKRAVAHLALHFLSPAALRSVVRGPNAQDSGCSGAGRTKRAALTATATATMHSVMGKFSNKSSSPSNGVQPAIVSAPKENLSSTAATTQDAEPPRPDMLESTVIWLLELLYRDAAQTDPSRRRYEQLLNATLPAIAAASVREAFVMAFSFRSSYPECRYDAELLGAWRTRVQREVGGSGGGIGAGLSRAEVQATFAATMRFFSELDTFCQQELKRVGSRGLEAWLVEYCMTGEGGQGGTTLPTEHVDPTVAATAGTGVSADSVGSGVPTSLYSAPRGFGTTTTPSASSSTFCSQRSGSTGRAIYMDLPHPIFNPFRPSSTVLLRSVRVSQIHVEATSSTRPVWLSLSSLSEAGRIADAARLVHDGVNGVPATSSAQGSADAPHKGPNTSQVSAKTERIVMFLYKLENAERDQLMCISNRLMELLLRDQIRDARLTNYSVLPLSCESALIERAEAHTLSKLPGVSATGDLAAYLSRLGLDARRNFLVSAKMFLLLNYIFSIGDRHAGNVMVSYHGAILHIDFGYIFSHKTTEERLAGSSIRVDSPFLAAVTSSRAVLREHELSGQRQNGRAPTRGGRRASGRGGGDPAGVTSGRGTSVVSGTSFLEEHAAFFNEAADWFLALRPHSSVFYELWLYAVNRRTLEADPGKVALAFNMLFDRNTSRESCHHKFASTMRSSVNVCRFKDATYYSMQRLKSYREHLGETVSSTYDGAMRALGSVWPSSR